MLEIERPTTWVALTGFMGVGKSRIGRELARELMLHFIDLDRYIERETGLSIPDIFRHLGEGTFRQLEAEAVAELTGKDFLVLSLGGGTFVSSQNRESLLQRGPVVSLWASPQTIYERVSRRPGQRPILDNPNPAPGEAPTDMAGLAYERIQRLLAEREAIYRQATIHVSTDGRRVPDVVDEIIKKLWNYADEAED
jgi:shikimate kinase